MKFKWVAAIGLSLGMGLGGAACKGGRQPSLHADKSADHQQAPGEATSTAPASAGEGLFPCAIKTRRLGADEQFKTAMVLEETGPREYVAKMDSNQDGQWDLCIKTRWEGADGVRGEVDHGCDGEVNIRTHYTPDAEFNVVTGIINEDAEMTLIVSDKNGYFSEHTAYPILGPRTNYRLEADATGRITELHDHGEITHFTYNDADQLLKIHGEDGTIVEYDYDGDGNMEYVRWFKRDLEFKLAYDCQ